MRPWVVTGVAVWEGRLAGSHGEVQRQQESRASCSGKNEDVTPADSPGCQAHFFTDPTPHTQLPLLPVSQPQPRASPAKACPRPALTCWRYHAPPKFPAR